MSFVGALLLILGLGGLTFGFIESSTFGFGSPIIIGPVLFGGLAIARFLHGERKGKHAILPLRLFRSRTFSAANLITLVFHGVIQPMLVYLPLNLIQVQGYSATVTGLAIVPLILMATVGSTLVGPLLDRRGPRLPLVLGLCVSAAGFVLFSNVGVTGGESEYFSTFFPPIFLFGIGFGMVFAPLTMAAMASAPDNNAGIASGVNNTVVRTGQVLVIGILGGLAISWFGQNLTNDPYILSLPAAAQSHLAADAGDLAGTSIPDTLTEDEKQAVHQVVRRSFADMFSTLMSIAAVFCLLASLIAWFLIDDRELKSKRRRDIEDELKPKAGYAAST
jgi:MFS family permease